MSSDLENLCRVPAGVETRWATAENPGGGRGAAGRAACGRKGAPCLPLRAGGQVVLAEATGTAGMVRRIWLTISDRSPAMLRGIRLDLFWDGRGRPAVSAPLGDFFGVGLGRTAAFESALFSNPEGRSFNCIVPMPFRYGMRIVVTNETDRDLPMLFYEVDYTVGDALPDDALYFHTHWRRDPSTIMQRDYVILPHVHGRGRYIGCNIGVIANRKRYLATWWGEGEVKVFLDGDTEWPTLCGTGTEDYIGTGWGQGLYAHRWQGCTVADKEQMRYCFYRYHGPDPVIFHREARITIQQIGWGTAEMQRDVLKGGQPLFRNGPSLEPITPETSRNSTFEREGDDWSSCAYFYLDSPENGLPPLPPPAERTPGLGEVPDSSRRLDA